MQIPAHKRHTSPRTSLRRPSIRRNTKTQVQLPTGLRNLDGNGDGRLASEGTASSDCFPNDEYGFDDAQRLSFSPDRNVLPSPSLRLFRAEAVCYLELFADVENHKVLFEKEIKIQDDYGKDVYVNDGYKKDEKNVLFYFKEFCYKDFNFAEHNEETVKKSGASISADELKKLINDKDVTSGDFDTKLGKAKEKDRLEKGHEKGYGYKLARRDFDDFDRDGLQFDRFPKDEYGFDDAQRLSFSPDRDVGLDGGFGPDSFKDKKDNGDHRYKHKETTKEYGYDSRKGKDGKKDGRKDW